jgi:hypothetical protein
MKNDLPPLLMTSEPGSFARSTIVERKPHIIAQVSKDHAYPASVERSLEALRQEIAVEPVQLLADTETDATQWNGELAAYRGKTWLELPWYLAEAYFYRRLLGAVRYLEPGPWQGRDPFAPQKLRQQAAAAAWLEGNWELVEELEVHQIFETLLHSCLWGNRADLSNNTIRQQVPGGLAARTQLHNILIDDTAAVDRLLSGGVDQVDFINDNVGLELVFDLALADFLLEQGWVQSIVLHLKDRPFFVSDAMPRDVEELVSRLSSNPMGQRLTRHLASDRIVLRAHAFWTSGLMYDRMPPSLADTLASAGLVIAKGDVNYRRLLGDRHWPYETQLEEIVSYFPATLLVLRTLKGEIMVGLEPGQAQELAAEDPSWLINGKRGIVQLVRKQK